MGRFERVMADELEAVRAGGAIFKAVRGGYGGGRLSSPNESRTAPGTSASAPRKSRSVNPRPRCIVWKPSVAGGWSDPLPLRSSPARFALSSMVVLHARGRRPRQRYRPIGHGAPLDETERPMRSKFSRAGQPNVAGKSIGDAGLRGDIDHAGALNSHSLSRIGGDRTLHWRGSG